MRAVLVVVACVLVACSATHEGDAPEPASADLLVGAWSRVDGRCEYAFLFDAHGRYDAIMACDDGDGRTEAGTYEAVDGVISAMPDESCAARAWEAPYKATVSTLVMGGLSFDLLADDGPFIEPVTCD